VTATNHVLTGAVIATVVGSPAIAIPVAFASHFVLDAIPHFGIHEDDVLKRNGHWLFRGVIITDTTLTIAALAIVPVVLRSAVSGWFVLAAMVAALIPDLLWIPHFIHEVRHNVVRARNKFMTLHQRIQWSETPWGLLIELLWIAASIVLMALAT
jgi:hypothetical protein